MVDREQLEELSYQPAANVACDGDRPVSGETTFCGVPYTFSWKPNDDRTANGWGDWYDLNPINPDAGLPMRAMGHFRSLDSVKWTSMGSPALSSTANLRPKFRAFIMRLIDESATYAHWDAFCVAHYLDKELEQVRRECVRLFLNRESLSALQPFETDKLLSLADRLDHEGG